MSLRLSVLWLKIWLVALRLVALYRMPDMPLDRIFTTILVSIQAMSHGKEPQLNELLLLVAVTVSLRPRLRLPASVDLVRLSAEQLSLAQVIVRSARPKRLP